MKVLITGMAGTGKTTIIDELVRREENAFDLDETGFCHWINKETNQKAQHLAGAGEEWLSRHSFRCVEKELSDFLNTFENQDVYIGGKISKSQVESIFRFFDKVFLISPSDEVLTDRLLNRTNKKTDFGKDPGELKNILSGRKQYEDICVKNGAIKISNEIGVGDVADYILG